MLWSLSKVCFVGKLILGSNVVPLELYIVKLKYDLVSSEVAWLGDDVVILQPPKISNNLN